MNKSRVLFLAGLCSFLLSACNQSSTNQSNQTKEEPIAQAPLEEDVVVGLKGLSTEGSETPTANRPEEAKVDMYGKKVPIRSHPAESQNDDSER